MSSETHTILYVEDDQDFLDSMRMFLEANGYRMVEARSAQEGLKAFNATRPDSVIVDLMMEEVDAGITLVKELKLAGCDVPVYMLSTAGDALNQSVAYEDLGLAGVLQKPMDFDALLQILQTRLK